MVESFFYPDASQSGVLILTIGAMIIGAIIGIVIVSKKRSSKSKFQK